MIADGLLTLDPLGLGYATAPNGLSIGKHGLVDGIYVLGPACKARDWEHTAVPELRNQAELFAMELIAQDRPKRMARERLPAQIAGPPIRRAARLLEIRS